MKLIPIFLPEKSCPFHCAFCNVRTANGEDAPINSPGDVQEKVETALGTLTVYHPDESVEIAFFGGTFTAGDPELMALYLKQCVPFMEKNRVSGIRISTRPDCVNEKIILLLKEHGVTTVELGVESFDDRVLRSLKRGHSAETAIHAVGRLQSSGFTTGIHLMTGCPEETEASFQETVFTTMELKPDTVRLHPLLVLTDTELAKAGYEAPGCEETLNRLAMATYSMESVGISVIRIGLQPTDSLTRPGQILSGCFHAALRHRVVSRIYQRFFRKINLQPKSSVTVPESHFSYAIGFKRENVIQFPGLTFVRDNKVKPWDVLINGSCYHMLTEGLYEIKELFER